MNEMSHFSTRALISGSPVISATDTPCLAPIYGLACETTIADEYKEFSVAFNWLSSVKISELSQLSATQRSSELAEERSAEVLVADLDECCLKTATSPADSKRKVKEADLYSAFIEVPYTQGAQ